MSEIANINTLQKISVDFVVSDLNLISVYGDDYINLKELPEYLKNKCIMWDSENEQFVEDTDAGCCKEKTYIVKEYNNKFTEFDRAWSAKVARGLATATEMNTARALIVTELTTALSEVE